MSVYGVSPKNRSLFCVPWTVLLLIRVKRVHRTSGQSAVRRHTRASIVAIVVVVAAVAVVLIATIALQRPLMVVMQPRLVMR